jgi:hypothetical protein
MTNPPPTIADGVGRRIRAACAHRGINFEQLSTAMRAAAPDMVGTGVAQLKRYGTDMSPRVEQLALIADITGMPLWYLVAGIDGLDHAHNPDALSTVPSETLAEVQALRQELHDLATTLKGTDQ